MGGSRALRLDINVSAITSGNVTFTVQGMDQGSQTWVDLLATTAITTVSRTKLLIGLGVTAAANAAVNDIPMEQYRINASGTGVGVSATVFANYLPA